MRRTLLAIAALAWGLAASNVATGAPKIALNVDGQANYSFLAPWSNIVGQFDPNNNLTYWTGYVDGNYAVTWTGSGTPGISGAKSSFRATGANTGILTLAHDNPGPNGGGIFTLAPNGTSNIKIIAPDTVAGTPFRKPFLDKVDRLVHGSTIRYMDWMQTNASPVVEWADRNTTFYQTSAAGVNYENIVALSNYTKANPWVCVPHKASDDYVRQLARFLKSNLDPSLKVQIEYSNELWNGGDQAQGTWNLQQARADSQFTKPDDTGRMAQRSAERLRQINEIFKQEFGGSSRLIPTIGGFIANSYWGQWQIDWLKSKGVNLTADNYRIAIAPYVPGSPTDLGETASDSIDTIFTKMRAFMDGNIKTWIRQNKSVATAAGISLDSYEAAAGSFYGTMNLDKHIALQNDPRLGQLYKDFITMWDTESGGGLFNAFGLVSPYSQWGQWGLLNDVNATSSVKFDAVASFVAASTPTPVPEPAAIGLVALASLWSLGRRGRRHAA